MKTVEGETLPGMVIYKFKDFQSAKDWYYAPEGKDVNLFRQAITEGWVAIVPGVDETQGLIDSGYFEG